MEIKTTGMARDEIAKVALLIKKAANLNMELSSYGELGYNQNSGDVYLWLEDYPFALYIPFGVNDIHVCFACPNCGEEYTREAFKNLENYYTWVEKLEYKGYCIKCK